MDNLVVLVPISGVIALAFAYMKAQWVLKQDAGTEEMQEIARRIQEGAMAFLDTEYRVFAKFVVVVAILLALVNMNSGTELIAAAFVAGAVLSALAGFFGMKIATDANVRTTAVATKGIV
jgi:K(+)-stimulated pyrophosphate-energized sodium pump